MVPPAAIVAGGIVAAAAASGITWLVRRWAVRALLDIPNERSSHTLPTPKGGGISIVAVTVIGAWAGWLALEEPIPALPLVSWTIFGLLISAVSFVDDMRPLPNRIRFTVHSVGAIAAIVTGGYWGTVLVPLVGTIDLGVLGIAVTFVWIAGLTNAWNFMDGIDGIAAAQAAVAGLAWFALGEMAGSGSAAALGLALAASNLGFLTWNWPPARIFMGDVGSAFVGYTLGVLPLVAMATAFGGSGSPSGILPLLSVLVVWPFVFDSSLTLLRRLRRRENLFAAHRSHLYQRMVISGLSHSSVSVGYTVLAAVGGLVAWALLVDPASSWAVAAVIALLAAALGTYTRRCERIRTP